MVCESLYEVHRYSVKPCNYWTLAKNKGPELLTPVLEILAEDMGLEPTGLLHLTPFPGELLSHSVNPPYRYLFSIFTFAEQMIIYHKNRHFSRGNYVFALCFFCSKALPSPSGHNANPYISFLTYKLRICTFHSCPVFKAAFFLDSG